MGVNVRNVKPVTHTHLFLSKYYHLYSSTCVISLNIRMHILAELAIEKLTGGLVLGKSGAK